MVQPIPWLQLGQKGLGARALLPDLSQGGVWLGFIEGGISYFKDGEVRASYTAANGLGHGRVNRMRFGSRGTLWAATEGGLSRIRVGRGQNRGKTAQVVRRIEQILLPRAIRNSWARCSWAHSYLHKGGDP